MTNKSLMIINHNTPCSCACKYCFFKSCKTSNGVEYAIGEKIALQFDKWRKDAIGEKIALQFDKWRKDAQLSDFSLCYAISHCADYPELIRNIELNKSLNFIGYSFLQINGIGLRDEKSLYKYLTDIKKAGVTTVDTTFYGLEEYHDKFASRKGDFQFLMNIVKIGLSLGLTLNSTCVVFEDNKEQLIKLIDILTKLGCENIYGFIHDYRGNGENLEDIRLTKDSYDALPDKVKKHINIPRHKTESEWLKENDFAIPTSRNLVLALRPDNIKMIQSISCDEIINYIVELDEKYYSEIPDINTLSKQYGDISNSKLYRQRDLQWKWEKAYIKDNHLAIHDITDQRNCGSMRY